MEDEMDKTDPFMWVPSVLRQKTSQPQAMANFLVDRLRNEPAEMSWGFINGALNHQLCLAQDGEQTSKPFTVILKDIEEIDRGPGKKLELSWDGEDFKSHKPKVESITTGYFVHKRADEFAFEIALSTTIYYLAEKFIGKPVQLTKAFTLPDHEGNSYRYLANIAPGTLKEKR